MSEQKASLGRIVQVTLDSTTAGELTRLGGNSYAAGDKIPAMIGRVWANDVCNLKAFADGPTDLWITSVHYSPDAAPRSWNWPERV